MKTYLFLTKEGLFVYRNENEKPEIEGPKQIPGLPEGSWTMEPAYKYKIRLANWITVCEKIKVAPEEKNKFIAHVMADMLVNGRGKVLEQWFKYKLDGIKIHSSMIEVKKCLAYLKQSKDSEENDLWKDVWNISQFGKHANGFEFIDEMKAKFTIRKINANLK